MKLSIKNIGKLKEAEVEINGITIITGENNTGKSTVGKILWTVFNSFFEIKNQVKKDKINSVFEEIIRFQEEIGEIQKLKNKIIYSQIADEIDLESFINQIEMELKTQKNESENTKKILKKIKKIVNLSDRELIKEIAQKNFDNEFNAQINNLNLSENGNIKLDIKKQNLELIFNNNKIQIDKCFSLYTKPILIDNPRIIDNLNFSCLMPSDEEYHFLYLIRLLREHKNLTATERILNKEKLLQIEKIVNNVVSGSFEKSKRTYIYKNNDGIDLNIRNLSTGLKTFSIIKLLLLNNQIEENGTIILEEPEIHLHPEWQLKFAELIVLLQKEFGLHILLTTHSPYFMNAIEVFSEKYKIDEKCKYYIAKNEGNNSVIKDITDNTNKIYQKMARPIQELENVRYSDYE